MRAPLSAFSNPSLSALFLHGIVAHVPPIATSFNTIEFSTLLRDPIRPGRVRASTFSPGLTFFAFPRKPWAPFFSSASLVTDHYWQVPPKGEDAVDWWRRLLFPPYVTSVFFPLPPNKPLCFSAYPFSSKKQWLFRSHAYLVARPGSMKSGHLLFTSPGRRSLRPILLFPPLLELLLPNTTKGY